MARRDEVGVGGLRDEVGVGRLRDEVGVGRLRDEVGVGRLHAFWSAVRRARASVRVRVTLLAAGAFAVTVVLAATILLDRLESALVDDLRADSEAVLTQQLTLIGEHGLPSTQVIQESGDSLVTYYANGRILSFALPEGMSPDEFNASITSGTAVSGAPNASLQVQAVGGAVAQTGVAGSDVISTSAPLGAGVLAIASPLDEVRNTIGTTSRLLWIVGPVLVALVAGLAWVLAGRALRPVRLLTSQVASIESGSLHERVPEPCSADEIAALARTMNEMLGRLDAANESSKRLVSDASHELRTPIAVMRTELEVARRDAVNDWTATGDTLLEELDRLALLVDDLLLLARGQERQLVRSPVELVDLVHEVAARRRRADVSVAVSVADEVREAAVDGDRAALGRALDHLVANAARSARSATAVSIAALDDGRGSDGRGQDGRGAAGRVGWAIHVDDDGPGIPAEHRAAVVRRFVRLDDARTRDAGGAGLGLAVASDVAAAHGGRLEIGDSPLGGARVSILLGRQAFAPVTMTP